MGIYRLITIHFDSIPLVKFTYIKSLIWNPNVPKPNFMQFLNDLHVQLQFIKYSLKKPNISVI